MRKLNGERRVYIQDSADVGHVELAVREMVTTLQLEGREKNQIIMAVVELAQNYVQQARRGEIVLLPRQGGGIVGIDIRVREK